MKKKIIKNKSKILVTTRDWVAVHPKDLHCAADPLYAQLSSRLANFLYGIVGDSDTVTKDDFKIIGIDLAAYLEDKINGINLWNSFISLYREKYGREYPFFDVKSEDLIPDEPNLPDIRFLLWRGFSVSDPDSILNPLMEALQPVVEGVYDMLMEEFESIPESPELVEALYSPEIYDDPIKFRQLCCWIANNAYLTCIADPEESLMSVYETYYGFFEDSYPESVLFYGMQSYYSFNTKCGPLALPTTKWLGRMLEMSDVTTLRATGDKIGAIRTLSLLPYEVVSVGADSCLLRSLSGSEMKLSFMMLREDSIKDIKSGQVLITSLFDYEGSWQVNGLMSISDKKETIKAGIKEYTEKKDNQHRAYKYLTERNGGKRIGVAKDWTELSVRLEMDKAYTSEDEYHEEVKKSKNILYFIDSDGSMSVVPELGAAVALPDNKYYDKEFAEENGSVLITGNMASDELRKYLIENRLIPDACLVGDEPESCDPKEWFSENASFINDFCHTDEIMFNLP